MSRLACDECCTASRPKVPGGHRCPHSGRPSWHIHAMDMFTCRYRSNTLMVWWYCLTTMFEDLNMTLTHACDWCFPNGLFSWSRKSLFVMHLFCLSKFYTDVAALLHGTQALSMTILIRCNLQLMSTCLPRELPISIPIIHTSRLLYQLGEQRT